MSDDVIDNSLALASEFVLACAREFVDPLFLLKPSQPAGMMLELALALVERRGDSMVLAKMMDEIMSVVVGRPSPGRLFLKRYWVVCRCDLRCSI